ncbi:PH domain-containing protein [Sphingomicrobium clamense]|uniref:PH domain-containing protein n=1 Tax=Sphingomicrobium clamense TaxID=2851013 RepID=A0ABS6V8C1_9SPHN|nr:PH domain-containing protein [Sphingomicrobium sp. B8]MBW0145764.1 PH domain-containing protein [Sphingomicrobium sp. B8]
MTIQQTDAASEAPLPETIDPIAPRLPAGMHPVEPAYRWVLRIQFILLWAPFLVGALVLDNFVLSEQGYPAYLSLAVAVLALAVIVIVPQRIWRRLGYRLSDRSLRVVRGWLFHTDTIVPFVRVQHLDVTRGPLEKLLGTASLIVHTAGTHNSVVTLPGLDPEKAEEMRAAIRAEIRTDWQ